MLHVKVSWGVLKSTMTGSSQDLSDAAALLLFTKTTTTTTLTLTFHGWTWAGWSLRMWSPESGLLSLTSSGPQVWRTEGRERGRERQVYPNLWWSSIRIIQKQKWRHSLHRRSFQSGTSYSQTHLRSSTSGTRTGVIKRLYSLARPRDTKLEQRFNIQ